jgi:prepilin-type N-terminal cleavage/methylation domain-containing protein
MNQKGVTLFELLIVISVLAILAAVAFGPKRNDNTAVDRYHCRYGMKYDLHGRQIIGLNGGGIPCDNAVVGPKPN